MTNINKSEVALRPNIITRTDSVVPLDSTNLLGDLDAFQALNTLQLEDIAHLFNHCFVQTGEFMTLERSQNNYVYFIIEGSLKVATYTAKGREVCFDFFGKNHLVGALTPFISEQDSIYYYAKKSCRLLRIKQVDLMHLAALYSSVNEWIIYYLTNALQMQCQRVYEFTALNSKERTRSELLRLAVRTRKSQLTAVIKELPTHEEIANMITSHREAVTKELSALRKLGLIDKRGKSLVLLNTESLEQKISGRTAYC